MRLAIRAARDHAAQKRLVMVAEQLAGMLPIPQEMVTAVQVQQGDEQTRSMIQREALADLLEAVAGHVGGMLAEAKTNGEPGEGEDKKPAPKSRKRGSAK